MVAAGELCTPTRVPQGVLNAKAYFQAVMADVLKGLLGHTCLVRVDDVVMWASDEAELLGRLEAVLDRLLERGLYAAVHKAVLHGPKIRW